MEDEEDLAFLFKEALSVNRLVVTVFTDPEVAVESICTNHLRYCLVLSDVRMPKMNGIELIKRIYETDRNIKLILMSAFDKGDIPTTLDYEFMQKPIRIEELKEMVYRSVDWNLCKELGP